MDSNTHSSSRPDRLAALAAAVDGLAAQDLDRLGDAALAEQVLQVRRQLDRLEGQWLRALAAVDGRGAAGAEHGVPAASTAAWLRHRLRMGAGTAAGVVRTARALHRGPLTGTAQALAEGVISPAHAQVLAHGTHDLPDHLAADAEPVLVAAARRLDPPRLRRVVAQLRLVADPTTPTRPNSSSSGGGCGWRRPGRAWSPSTACWTPRPARAWWRRWSPWPARPTPTTPAAHSSVGPMPWPSWPAVAWKPAACRGPVGCGLSCW
jgi:hypothetical protein